MSAVDEIKAKLDIVAYIQRTVPLKRAGRVYKAPCPFHNERTPSFVVNPDTQSWRCFGACAEGGDLFKFAMKQNGWSFREALEELGRMAGVEVRPQTPEQRDYEDANDRLRGMIKTSADFFHEHLLDTANSAAVRALKYTREKRALTDETIAKFQIGYAPASWDALLSTLTNMGYSENDLVLAGLVRRNEEGRVYDAFRSRLMIPIRDERGRMVGFGARALAAEDNPKYLNSPQSPIFDKSKLLFALNFAAPAIRESETVVIVEGYLDAIQAHQAGYGNIVAQMGTALTESQIKLVAPRWTTKVVLALDSDAAGQNATRRSLEVARATLQADYAGRLGVEFRVLSVPDAKDPDDFIRENPQMWPQIVEAAIPVADFVIGMEADALNENPSIQEREAAVRRLLPILSASEDDLYRSSNLQKLAIRFKLQERDLLMWMSDQPQPTQAKAPRQPVDEPPPNFADGDPLVVLEPAAPKIRDIVPSETDMEAYCLRALFTQPDAYYAINRKLRELAAQLPGGSKAALDDFSTEDFSRTAYRVLMQNFEDALAQDEIEFVEYLRQNLDDSLLNELDAIMLDQHEAYALRVGQRLPGDLAASIKASERQQMLLDINAELVEMALRLRERRLSRERQELAYLEIEGENAVALQELAMSSLHAKRLIDMEISRQLHAWQYSNAAKRSQ